MKKLVGIICILPLVGLVLFLTNGLGIPMAIVRGIGAVATLAAAVIFIAMLWSNHSEKKAAAARAEAEQAEQNRQEAFNQDVNLVCGLVGQGYALKELYPILLLEWESAPYTNEVVQAVQERMPQQPAAPVQQPAN